MAMSRFDRLLADLAAEHTREVEDLQSQIASAQECLTQSRGQLAFLQQQLTQSIEGGLGSCGFQQTVDIPASGVEVGSGPVTLRQRLEERIGSRSIRPGGSFSFSMQESTKSSPDDPSKERVESAASNTPIASDVVRHLFPALGLEAALRKAKAAELTSVHQSAIKKVLESGYFEWFVMALITANAFVMACDMQCQGRRFGSSLGIEGYSQEETWFCKKGTLQALERVFVVIFTTELILRLFVYRIKFFEPKLNYLDVMVVIFGWFDWVAGSDLDPKMLRLFRVTKVARIMRSVKNQGFWMNLYFLTTSMYASLRTLVWALVLLAIISCVATILEGQLLYSYFVDASRSDAATAMFLRFGTFTRTAFTMFEVLLGNWVVPARVLLDTVGEGHGMLLLLYKLVCGFAVINIISAVLLQQTMKIMSQDTDIMLLERSRAEKKFQDGLMKLFVLLDVTHDGMITRNDVSIQLETAQVRQVCFDMGLSVHDLEDILHTVNLRSGTQMPIEEFFQAAQAVRRQANTLDVARVLMYSRQLRDKIEDVQAQCEKTSIRIEEVQSILCQGAPGSLSL